MNSEELKDRTSQFALRVVNMCAALPRDNVTDVLGKQLLRAGTSVGANYRAACRARSRAEFVSKMAIVEEEADECGYWIQLLIDSGIVAQGRVAALLGEANELTAIAAASRETARGGPAGGVRATNRQSTIDNRQSS
jgi:four helix bundle protein